MPNFSYKSFCWSLGTTSFRTKNFNRTIELQLSLLYDFWNIGDNNKLCWSGNAELQTAYYVYMQKNEFIDGEATNKPKDAREKTSGLVDLGLIDENRRLTEVGKALLEISKKNDYTSDNFFGIPKDSYIYLKQLLKTFNYVNEECVRPFIVMLYILNRLDYLSLDEYTFLLPLCTNESNTENIINGITLLRQGKITIDEVIISRLMEMDNYKEALSHFLDNDVDENLICEIGLNRKSRQYDKEYFELYQNLYSVYVLKDITSLRNVYETTKKVNLGKWWRTYLFNTTSNVRINNQPNLCKRITIFDYIYSEEDFKKAFFQTMHLFKAKATLSDYFDLNRRYIKTTDIVLFEDNIVRLDIVPKNFFNSILAQLYNKAYLPSDNLFKNCEIEDIDPSLKLNEKIIIESVSVELGVPIATISEAQRVLNDMRYQRFYKLIETKFSDENIMKILEHIENRRDREVQDMVTDNADIPTIFEYIIGILWYKTSEYKGRILDYMKLSLDADLLPKTHACGGEADIVYEYEECEAYPAHSLLIEATLSESNNQRRMEMEPVSRHLGNYLLENGNSNTYCLFVSTFLNINVISDFRARKNIPYYDTRDTSRFVMGMKIIPLQTSELKKILVNKISYSQIYSFFEEAYHSELPPHMWYEPLIYSKLN